MSLRGMLVTESDYWAVASGCLARGLSLAWTWGHEVIVGVRKAKVKMRNADAKKIYRELMKVMFARRVIATRLSRKAAQGVAVCEETREAGYYLARKLLLGHTTDDPAPD